MIAKRIRSEKEIVQHVTQHGKGLIISHKLFGKNGFDIFKSETFDYRILNHILCIVKIDEFILKSRNKTEKSDGKRNRKQVFIQSFRGVNISSLNCFLPLLILFCHSPKIKTP